MLNLNLAHEADDALIVRVAWLYYVGGLTQEETAARLGLHRTRVTRLLSEARDRGLISITINHDSARNVDVEHAIARTFRLDFCISTPQIGFKKTKRDAEANRIQGLIARRAVGTAGASFLKGKLSDGPITVGVSWGRTIEQVALQLSGVHNPRACFVSLLGSLTRNAASNPFEVVQAFASRTGGEAHFLPVPFIADSDADRRVFLSQRIVEQTLELARCADLYLISVGELQESSVLRQQHMLSVEEIREVRAEGAVCDTLGRVFDIEGREVSHSLSKRTLALDIKDLKGRNVVLLGAGMEKATAIVALLRSGLVKGLIVDGDTALEIAGIIR
jgi:DNA-binding transcriptional regulator LsrR (DeoR family)